MPDEGLKQIFQDVKVGPPSDEPKDPSKQAVPVRNHTDKVFNVLLECQNDDGKKTYFYAPQLPLLNHSSYKPK